MLPLLRDFWCFLKDEDEVEPPPDHAEFIALRARGLAALRRSLEKRRKHP